MIRIFVKWFLMRIHYGLECQNRHFKLLLGFKCHRILMQQNFSELRFRFDPFPVTCTASDQGSTEQNRLLEFVLQYMIQLQESTEDWYNPFPAWSADLYQFKTVHFHAKIVNSIKIAIVSRWAVSILSKMLKSWTSGMRISSKYLNIGYRKYLIEYPHSFLTA